MIKLNLFSKVVVSDDLNLSEKQFNHINQNAKNEIYNNVEDIYSTKISKSLHVLDNLKSIKKIILDKFLYINKAYLKYDNDFKITTSWYTKSSYNNIGSFHNHSNNFYSGIYYIDVDNNSGDIEFCDFTSSFFQLNPIEYNIDNSKSWLFKPKNDMIIFFPSQLHHTIHLNKSKKDRYSLAFNIFPVGKIGCGDSILDTSKI